MKIAFDSQIFASQQHGGVSRAHARLAAALAAAGEAVRVVAPLHINAYLPDLDPALVYGHGLTDGRWQRRAARVANRIAEPALLGRFDPDIVQETYYRVQRTAPRRARSVVMVYDMIHELFPASFPTGDPTAAQKAAATARADHVLCISQSTLDDLVAIHPGVAGKASVVLLGFDPVQERPAVTAGGRPYLLFVGQRGGYKNFAGLLAAYAASPALRAEFDLLAVGGGAFTADETAAIVGHGLSGQVRQRAADDRALQACYAGATVFIYPSLYEGFGIPPLEAMAAGTPVVAMKASSVPEVCGDAAVYAQPDDAGSLQRAIEAVALSPTAAATLVAAGTCRLQLFSWDRSAATAAAAYRGLL
ncbi:MAG: glycosyltransferase family 4 protein [Polymorphobacter sp.]